MDDVSAKSLATHCEQYLTIQIFHDLLLPGPMSYVVVEAGSGVRFKNPIFFWWFLNGTVHHHVDTAKTQAHVAGEPYRDLFPFVMHTRRYINSIAARRQICVIEKLHDLIFFGHRTQCHMTTREHSLDARIMDLYLCISFFSNKHLLLLLQ